MTDWAPKRFWKAAHPVALDEGGFTVRLDDRPIRTPAKAALMVPTMALAEAIAAEWDAQEGKVDPRTMPMTKAVNAAIDKVTPQFDEVANLLAAYGESDLLCYRAEAPVELCVRQDSTWDPILAWARDALDAPLTVTRGIIPVTQPAASVARLRARVFAMDPYTLTALSELVSISGSLVLALAVVDSATIPDAAWNAARIDEDYQAEVWGVDDEAMSVATCKAADFHLAVRFLGLLQQTA